MLKYLRLWELRRRPLSRFVQKGPQRHRWKPPSTALTAGRSDWAERRFRRQPFILLSFSSSKKARKAQETQSYQRFQCIGHTDFKTSGTNGSRSLSQVKAGTHLPSPTGSHTAAHTRANRACFRWGWYLYPQRALRGPEPLRAQRSEEHSLPSLHGPREPRREAESLRNGDAHRARLRSEAPRPRRVALLHCCFLRCTGKLRGSLSLRRRAERKIC